MDAEIKAEFGHVNQKLDRMLKCQDEFITWQRNTDSRLSAGAVHFQTMTKAIGVNADDIDIIRRDNKIFSGIAAAVGAVAGTITGVFAK